MGGTTTGSISEHGSLSSRGWLGTQTDFSSPDHGDPHEGAVPRLTAQACTGVYVFTCAHARMRVRAWAHMYTHEPGAC